MEYKQESLTLEQVLDMLRQAPTSIKERIRGQEREIAKQGLEKPDTKYIILSSMPQSPLIDYAVCDEELSTIRKHCRSYEKQFVIQVRYWGGFRK